jgi:hypothetical protein
LTLTQALPLLPNCSLLIRLDCIEHIKASDDLLKDISGLRWRSIWEVMKNTVMLEPNFSGVGVDLKAARSRFLVTANIN